MKQRLWLAQVWFRLTHWSGEIEDRGAEGIISAEQAQRALMRAQDRSERVRSIKREVRVVQRKYE